MSDAARRGIRTLLDALLAVLAAGVVDAYLLNLDATQRATLVVALTGVISAVKNALEDRGAIPALLKAPASSGAHPLPEGHYRGDGHDHGAVDGTLLATVVMAIVLAALVLWVLRLVL